MTLLLLLLSCSGSPDGAECSATVTWYQDADGDGHGVGQREEGCIRPADGASVGDDCDDSSATVNPEAEESCNGLDDDCDGVIDPSTSIDAVLCYVDRDGDGWGTDVPTGRACTCPSGTSTVTGDCDDDHEDAHPGGTETWYDGVDGDCLGGDDFDADGDGYARQDEGDDCDDADPLTFPGAPEVCGDGLDQDCDLADPEYDCGLVGDMTPLEASAVIHNDVLAYFGVSLLYAGDNDGDGVGEVLTNRYTYIDGDGYGTQVIYVVNNLPRGADVGLLDDPVAVFEPPGWEWEADGGDIAPGANCYNPAVTGTDLDGDGYADFLLASNNTLAGAGGLPSRVDLWYGPASGIIDLADADTVLSTDADRFSAEPLVLTHADGAGAFQVAAFGRREKDDTAHPAVYLLDQDQFTGDAALDDAPGIWRPSGWIVGNLLESCDTDGDGVLDLLVKAFIPDRLDQGFVYAVFPGPLEGDLSLDDAEMVLDMSGGAEAGGAAFDFYVGMLTADESADGTAHLAVTGGKDPCDEGEGCGGVWVHPYAPGTLAYDEDPEVTLVGPPDTLAGTSPWGSSTWGGDLDGDEQPELYVYSDWDYRALDINGGGLLFIVEVPESGTWELADIYDAYLAPPLAGETQSHLGAVNLVGHDLDGDGWDDLATTSFAIGDSSSLQGRVYYFPGGPNGAY